MNNITIELGGKKRVMSFGIKMVSELLSHTGDGIGDLGRRMKNNPFQTTPLIIYFAAKNGEESLGSIPDFNLNDVYHWIEKATLKDEGIINCVTSFGKSIYQFMGDLYPDNKANKEGGQDQSDEVKKK